MAKFKSFEEAPSKGPHRDFEHNLRAATNFCLRIKPKLPEGMQVYITGGHSMTNNLLMISWNPGRHAKMGNYASPVDLNQSRNDFRDQVIGIYNGFMERISRFTNRANSLSTQPATGHRQLALLEGT